MKTLHYYLTRQVLATLAMTVVVFTFVLLLGNMLKEVLALLVNRQVTLGVVFQAVGLLIPFVLVHALPMGMLTAALLVFGRFSADQELTAVRASGISLLSLVMPILLLGIAMSVVCASINMEIAPACRTAYRNLFTQSAARLLDAPLPEGRFVQDFPGSVIYAEKVDGTNLENVLYYRMTQGEKDLSLRAERGTVIIDRAKSQLRLEFINCTVYTRVATQSTNESGDTNAPPAASNVKTNQYIWQQFSAGKWESDPISLDLSASLQQEPKLADMSFRQLLAKRAQLTAIGIEDSTPAEGQMQRQVEVQMHRQVAYSFACVGFTLIGIPLGIRVHRRETSIGLAIAIVLVTVYYGLMLLGQTIESRAASGSYLLLWLPNFLFQLIGGGLLWRANRGF